MKQIDIPFNIDLLILSKEWLDLIRPVTSLDFYENSTTKNLHSDGLYSVDIFGVPGTDARYTKESYIDIKLEIFHPLIYKCLVAMKSYYADILSGREFAVFDATTGDFIKSNALEGQTGFHFFFSHWKELKYEDTGSEQRQERIKLLEKYKEHAVISKVYVLPAGYRDLEVDDTGRESSDEINNLYSRLIAISNTVSPALLKSDIAAYNAQRMSLQNTLNDIYQMAFGVIKGKNNLMMSKWAGRKVFDSTRNVITAMDTTTPYLEDPGTPDFNSTMIGLLQFLKATRPVALHHLKTGFLSECFISPSAPALLVDHRTLKSTRVQVKPAVFDKWMSNEGLEKVINSYKEPSIRDKPIRFEGGYYLGLLYRGKDNTFKLFHGLDELPEGLSKEDCTPVTLTELFYISCYEWANSIPGMITRYPIATDRSVYPSMSFLMSTMQFDKRIPLDHEWKPVPEKTAYKFPIKGSASYDSLSPSVSFLTKLSADFDGDTSSLTAILSVEGQAEIAKLMNSRSFYVGPDGLFTANLSTDTIKYVMQNLTGH